MTQPTKPARLTLTRMYEQSSSSKSGSGLLWFSITPLSLTSPAMAKEKAKGQKGPGQKHLHSRISYLYQAATYLASVEGGSHTGHGATKQQPRPSMDRVHPEISADDIHTAELVPQSSLTKASASGQEQTALTEAPKLPLSRLFIRHLKAVSLKGQVRLTHEMKQSICSCCDMVLSPASTSSHSLENHSRGGKKAWADVLAVTCKSCGTVKRFPIGAKRQPRKADRVEKQHATAS